MSDTVKKGELLVLDKSGNVVDTFKSSAFADGPWDMAVDDQGTKDVLFISDVLSGTVTRIVLKATGPDSVTLRNPLIIASGYGHRADPAALEVGPTGLAFDASRDTLYVANTKNNKIYAVPEALTTTQDEGTGSVIYSDLTKLHGPLGLVLAANNHLIIADGDATNADPNQNSELVEITRSGSFIGEFSTDSSPAANFGIAVGSHDGSNFFAAVNDDNNTVSIWDLG